MAGSAQPGTLQSGSCDPASPARYLILRPLRLGHEVLASAETLQEADRIAAGYPGAVVRERVLELRRGWLRRLLVALGVAR